MTTILVIEDEYAIAEMLQDVLEDEGYTVLRAGNGLEGVNHLVNNRVDLILSDVMMPVMDGYTFCRVLHADPATASIPLIMMSAVGEEALSDDEWTCNYVAFLQKPFGLTELLDLLQQFTSIQQ